MASRDRLRVVGSGPDAAAETAEELQPAPPARGGRTPWVVAAVLLVVLAVGAWRLVGEHQRVVALEARVEALGDALSRAEGEIAAREQHLEAVRSGVSRVQQEVGALAELVARDPTAPAPDDAAAKLPAETQSTASATPERPNAPQAPEGAAAALPDAGGPVRAFPGAPSGAPAAPVAPAPDAMPGVPDALDAPPGALPELAPLRD